LKAAKKNGTLIGGEYIAPVAPREELFMGHQTINEIQKPGLATGYGIPEHGRMGSPLGLGGQGSPSRMMGSPSQFQQMGSPSRLAQNYTAQSLGGQQYTTGSSYTTTGQQYTSGSPRVIYESAMPTTTSYSTGQSIGGTCCNETSSYVQQQPITTTYIQQQPMQQMQQMPMQQQ
jgi:hypothetical protein